MSSLPQTILPKPLAGGIQVAFRMRNVEQLIFRVYAI